MLLYFIRHGQTVWNADGRIQGHLDTELSPLGISQARVAAHRMASVDLSAVYSSDLRRASMTAEAVAASHGLDVIKTPLLREANLGRFQGLTLKEAEEKHPEAFKAYRADGIRNRPPGGETLEDVVNRCRIFLKDICDKHPDETICVVGHGGTGRGIVCAAFDLPVGSVYGRIHLDNAGLTTIEFADGKPLLVALNDTCHLTDAEYAESIQEY